VYLVIETSFSAFPFRCFFAVNMAAVSDEHGERFDHGISEIEKRYSRKLSPNMLVDCCCSLIMETPTGKYKRQKKKDEVSV
jgi:hypothetical protein